MSEHDDEALERYRRDIGNLRTKSLHGGGLYYFRRTLTENKFRDYLADLLPSTAAPWYGRATSDPIVNHDWATFDNLEAGIRYCTLLRLGLLADWLAMEHSPSWYSQYMSLVGTIAFERNPDLMFLAYLLNGKALSFRPCSYLQVQEREDWDRDQWEAEACKLFLPGAERSESFRRGRSQVEVYRSMRGHKIAAAGPVPPYWLSRLMIEGPLPTLIGRPFLVRCTDVHDMRVGMAWIEIDPARLKEQVTWLRKNHGGPLTSP